MKNFKNQITEILGLAFEVQQKGEFDVTFSFIGPSSILRIVIYDNKVNRYKELITSFRVVADDPILEDELSADAAILYFRSLLQERGVTV